MKKIYGLLGRKLGHSYSEAIHHSLGCDSYKLTEVEPDKLESFFSSNIIGGYNVTIPYKKDVIPFCHSLSESAKATGSVNTLITDDSGNLSGFNTDIDGFEYMAKRAGIEFGGRKVLVFGSGGVSGTAVYCSKKGGASEIVVVSRNGFDNYTNLSKHYDAEILINATPVGMSPAQDESLIDISPFSNCKGVIDLIYNPLRTNLLIQASSLNIPNTNGLSMLVKQAVSAEELFFNQVIPEQEVDKLIEEIRSEKENIVLTGMPGCGKTTVAELIGNMSGRIVIDTDAEVEKACKMSIPDIIMQKGEDYFRDAESEAVAQASLQSGIIISTGGGVIKREKNYISLHRNGRIYHIERSLDLLSTSGRPLSQVSSLSQMYEERLPLYEKYRDCVVQNKESPETCAEEILDSFRCATKS